MPLNRLWLDATANDAGEFKSYVDSVQAELADVTRELELWDRAQPFMERLREMESSALELMVSGPPEDMPSIRERIRVIRTLLDQPKHIANRHKELESDLDLALAGE
jgi:hypothetical protein